MGKVLLLAAFSVGISFRAWAAGDVPPGFDQSKFANLISIVDKTGQVEDPGDGTEWIVLQHTTPPDNTVSHRLDYIDDASGTFIVSWEVWQLGGDKNWTIDQWIFQMDMTGTVSDMEHNQLVEDPSGEVLQDNSLTVDKAQALGALEQDLETWYAYVGIGSGLVRR